MPFPLTQIAYYSPDKMFTFWKKEWITMIFSLRTNIIHVARTKFTPIFWSFAKLHSVVQMWSVCLKHKSGPSACLRLLKMVELNICVGSGFHSLKHSFLWTSPGCYLFVFLFIVVLSALITSFYFLVSCLKDILFTSSLLCKCAFSSKTPILIIQQYKWQTSLVLLYVFWRKRLTIACTLSKITTH